MLQNGEFTETGTPVIQITNKDELLIEAFINQSDYQLVEGIFGANFRNSSNNKVLTLAELNGKVKSANAFVNENISRIPVIFSVQNNGLIMPGMFLEAFIMTNKKDNALVLPLSAIIEEQGRYFVFVEVAGESFIKREVTLKGNDGVSVEIAEGLKVGERVVTKGTQPIKLSSMAAGLPLHGHTH
jgi:multidrug efflux pump subunit AcrA (membrane-fusion protein)